MGTKRSFYSKALFCTLVSFLIILWSSHSFGYEWSKTFGGSLTDEGRSVKQTADGGYIIAGSTLNYSTLFPQTDVYLIKTDALGNESWSKAFGGSGHQNHEEGYSVQQTADGGYIIAGDANLTTGHHALLLVKTDALGNQIWSNHFDGIDQ